MYTILIFVFVIGYGAIVFEHPLKINKAAVALLTGVLCWVVYVVSSSNPDEVVHQLGEHLKNISGILFFLLGAMTIVEIIDAHDGFEVITRQIKTQDRRKLLWIIGMLTFFLSSVLDNLTTTIVMVSLLRNLIANKETRLLFVGMVVIAANAGGAWSPIGDVTTTMLWIDGQITSVSIMKQLIIPSLICLVVPCLVVSVRLKGNIEPSLATSPSAGTNRSEQRLVLFLGIAVLIMIPVFKTLTHLPPFMGILFGLALLWIVTEIIHKDKDVNEKDSYSVAQALTKADVPSVLFFLGILLSVAALESTGQLAELAQFLNDKIGNLDTIVIAIGMLSAVIDNVPLVAATQGMYDLQTFSADHHLWTFIAYSTGTGGSCLIIGSAAGVAAMGMEKIDFFWYLKKISLLALLGFFAGAIWYIVQTNLFN